MFTLKKKSWFSHVHLGGAHETLFCWVYVCVLVLTFDPLCTCYFVQNWH